MDSIKIRFDLLKFKRYFRENLGAPFIILFQVLLFLSGGFFTQGNSALADAIAVYSYYSLLIGVGLQLIFLSKGWKKKARR